MADMLSRRPCAGFSSSVSLVHARVEELSNSALASPGSGGPSVASFVAAGNVADLSSGGRIGAISACGLQRSRYGIYGVTKNFVIP